MKGFQKSLIFGKEEETAFKNSRFLNRRKTKAVSDAGGAHDVVLKDKNVIHVK